jgi:hypothetical protein
MRYTADTDTADAELRGVAWGAGGGGGGGGGGNGGGIALAYALHRAAAALAITTTPFNPNELRVCGIDEALHYAHTNSHSGLLLLCLL